MEKPADHGCVDIQLRKSVEDGLICFLVHLHSLHPEWKYQYLVEEIKN